ncbi:MAG: GNAT family N-acetyltransferase [Rubrobacteraceae bacterium]
MIEVSSATGDDFAEALKLLEESSRDGEPLPPEFVSSISEGQERGVVELLLARLEGSSAGGAFIVFRPNISAGSAFASIEELYVKPEARRRGVGQALLDAVEARCARKDISYVEVQAVEDEAAAFYRASGYEPEFDVRVFSGSVPLREGEG